MLSIRKLFNQLHIALAALALTGCATVGSDELAPTRPVDLQILAINDFHGNLEVPSGTTTYFAKGKAQTAQLGGAGRLAATLDQLRQGAPNSITVAAGDLIGASPLISAHFLDEPTIVALGEMGLSLTAVGNHEFDNGTAELLRLQQGGCEVHTARAPCQLEEGFKGADFTFLAANVIGKDGTTLLPGTAIRQFGEARVGFIGMTLKETATITSPAGTAGYRFADEANTANALADELKAKGADTVVLLLHQGGRVDPYLNQDACPGLEGDIMPILERLTPAIKLVVSGHTHSAYICETSASDGSMRLLTSAGRYGIFVTAIEMSIDPKSDRILSMKAVNQPVVEAAGEHAKVAELIARYSDASAQVAARPVGWIAGPLKPVEGALDTPLSRLVADAQLAATQGAEHGGAQIAFINSGGVRAAFRPAEDGTVTYGQIFALQPFGNSLQVLELTGAQLHALLEQQFAEGETGELQQSVLIPSQGFTYSFDASAPSGKRITEMRLNGKPIERESNYRITTNNFLASGGDGFSVFSQARFVADGGIDLDALETFIAEGVTVSQSSRIIRVGDRRPD